MNKINIAPVLLFFIVFSASAQNWKYDFEEAKAIAAQKNQNIVLLFTGSDWCPPCVKLERNVLSDPKFETFTDEHFVLLKADFPKRKKNRLSKEQQEKNELLAKRYNKRWVFPILLVLDPSGKVLGVTGYRRDLSVDRYISLLTSFE